MRVHRIRRLVPRPSSGHSLGVAPRTTPELCTWAYAYAILHVYMAIKRSFSWGLSLPSPLTSHLSPITHHPSSLTPHPSPLTSHLSPLTSHLSLSDRPPAAAPTPGHMCTCACATPGHMCTCACAYACVHAHVPRKRMCRACACAAHVPRMCRACAHAHGHTHMRLYMYIWGMDARAWAWGAAWAGLDLTLT